MNAYLIRYEVGEEVVGGVGALEVQVVGQVSLHPARVLRPESAGGDEHDDGDGYGQHHGEGEAETLDADLAGELAKDVGQVDADYLDERGIDGDRVLRPDLDRVLEEVLVRPDGARVLHLRDVDPMALVAGEEVGEDVHDGGAVQPQAEEHRHEEGEDLDQGGEGVDEVARLLQPLLDLPESLDESDGRPPVHVVLPPAAGG